MKKIRRVFKRDVNAITRNPVAILIILGVAVLPSLYAWVNIVASWDPYSNTSTIPVAIVNTDKGTILNDEYINIGENVVSELKDNDIMEWYFVESTEEADIELQEGKYYATITITETFSDDLVSILTDDVTKPVIIYKADTKENPVISKITNAVQESVVNNIKSNFLMTVYDTIFIQFNDISTSVKENEKTILNMKTYISVIDANLDSIINSLENTSVTNANLAVYLESIKATLPAMQSSIDNMMSDNDGSRTQAIENEETMKEVFKSLEDNAVNNNKSNEEMNILIKDMVSYANEATKDYQLTQAEEVKEYYQDSIDDVDSLIAQNKLLLEAATSEEDKAKIQANIDDLNQLKADLEAQSDNVDKLSEAISTSGDGAEQSVEEMTSAQIEANDDMTASLIKYNEDLANNISNINKNYIESTYISDESLDSMSESIDSFNKSLDVAIERSYLNNELSNELIDDLIYFQESIHTMSSMLDKIEESQIKVGIALLSIPAEEMADYLSNPFEIVDEAIYPIENYGSAMTPMYSALAMWVGAVILTSVFSTEIQTPEQFKDLSIQEKYLGKLILFGSTAFIQGLVLMFGNKFLLGVQTDNLFIFIILGSYCSFIFSIIVYTNVSLFGEFGKAINVVLLVLQIAGTGGAYPIQLDPLFFRIIQPFLPFTYTLDLLREAVAGVLVSRVLLDMIILTLMGQFSLFMGLKYKEKINNFLKEFNETFEESHLAE